ncbi:MAG: bifunctional phosphoribosylaminoimidazolecarboxamide formyltransferase/IMP cyclohydrolase [Bacteroidales bacterium]|nr:bifunctional phosphoribosylaminoimidazolecarboxamide formyltransferase/IMP cyclohydrolase [Bacteroidales bacterium]MCF8458070.1 bifunctional phosphoribosylaminoimidazolecarboxamide formyltransferase/IMP cyclohydrolase [Bacteroidales bacterium]
MNSLKKIKTALISVYHKDGLDGIVQKLSGLGIEIYSTGGTKKFIHELGVAVKDVEELTSYPSILGGRVKTLHPKVFGGILARRDNESDIQQMKEYEIPGIDLVIVDLYPFEETVKSGAGEQEIIEKIDIGGISLIRAAAKNFKDVLIVSSRNQYSDLLDLLNKKEGKTNVDDRRKFASHAFHNSSHYDTAIFNYFAGEEMTSFKASIAEGRTLRYGENPHQKGFFFGNFDEMFDQLHGKEISYNNLLDIDAAVNLIAEFDETTFAILKHNNACGLASRSKLVDAYRDALAGDPISAFGGILICNRPIDEETAGEVNKLFCEVVIAPSYSPSALEILKQKKNRIILVQKKGPGTGRFFRSLLNGAVVQDRDNKTEKLDDLKTATEISPSDQQKEDLLFANILVKHTKSNCIVLAKGKQLIASGTGQTSRVDALKQAIEKAHNFEFDLQGAVMASDAFFPFPDCVEIADNAGITSVIQPGGSVRDQESIDYCNKNNMSMVFTGTRHFRH